LLCDIEVLLLSTSLCVCHTQLGPARSDLNNSGGSLRTLSGNSLSNFFNDLVRNSVYCDIPRTRLTGKFTG